MYKVQGNRKRLRGNHVFINLSTRHTPIRRVRCKQKGSQFNPLIVFDSLSFAFYNQLVHHNQFIVISWSIVIGFSIQHQDKMG